MKIQPYVNKLHSSAKYKEFQERYKDAFLVAGFFVIDYETGKNIHQIDYYVPSQKKFAAFTLDKGIELQLMNTLDHKQPQKLDIPTSIDLDALQGIITDEMKNRSITQSIKKMIAVIQNTDGRNVWNVNCILSGMDLLRVHVEDASRTVLKMEKASLMDFIKRLPNPATDAQSAQGAPLSNTPAIAEDSNEAIERKIAQLDKLKELLKKEKIDMKKPAKVGKTDIKLKPKKSK